MCNMLNVYAFLYFIPTFILFVGGRVILMVNRKEFVGSITIQGLSVWSVVLFIQCSCVRVLSRYFGFLPQSRGTYVRVIGNSNFKASEWDPSAEREESDNRLVGWKKVFWGFKRPTKNHCRIFTAQLAGKINPKLARNETAIPKLKLKISAGACVKPAQPKLQTISEGREQSHHNGNEAQTGTQFTNGHTRNTLAQGEKRK